MKRFAAFAAVVVMMLIFTPMAFSWDPHPGRGWQYFGSDSNNAYYYLPGGTICSHAGSICYCQIKQVDLNRRTTKSAELQVKCGSKQSRLCYRAKQCTAWQSATKLMSFTMFAEICSKR